jgi:signal peptide peptidase SppA
MIHPPKLEVIIKALGPRLGIDPDAVLARRVPMGATATLMARYSDTGDERDYAVLDGVAVVPVQGTLLKKESFLSAWSGATSYEQIQRQVAQAVDDASVRAILLDVDSPGGETTGCFELADYIYSIRGVKPVYAAANDIALSAAYAIASSASRVFVTRTGAVGSIGVYALHVDQSGFDKDIGAKYTFIFAGDKKVDGNPHEPLSESARSDIQAEVDREYAIFVETVARNRKAATKAIVGTQAGLLWAENALPLLADEVGTIDDALAALAKVAGARTKSFAATAANPTTGESMNEEMQALAAKKECDEKADDKKSKKAAAPLISAEPLKAMRAEADIQAIAALCKVAGCPEKAAEFLMQKNSRGEYMSVAEVSEALTSSRVAESEKHMISSHVNPNAGSGGVQELEAQSVALARQNRGQVTPGMYVSGTATKVTKERAYAQMLEEHPEAYAAFRAQHNAKGLIATLEAAGVRLAR